MKIAVIGAVSLALFAGACGSSDNGNDASMAQATPSMAPSSSAAMTDKPFGPGCTAVPADGAGSFSGMAQDPVATAASNNPALSTLVTAVKAAGLVDTLNTAKAITVFAPTNDAFAKVPKADLDKLLANKDQLTKVLTYHVVDGKKAPADLANGDFTTLEGGKLTTSGSGESYKVNDTANVVCGNVQTSNATVYLIDSVLMPPS